MSPSDAPYGMHSGAGADDDQVAVGQPSPSESSVVCLPHTLTVASSSSSLASQSLSHLHSAPSLVRVPSCSATESGYSGPLNLSQCDVASCIYHNTFSRYTDLHPSEWATISGLCETDDELHDPEKRAVAHARSPRRAFLNVGTLLTVVLATFMLFVGYPVLSHFTTQASARDRLDRIFRGRQPQPPLFADKKQNRFVGASMDPLIDPDTPKSAYFIRSTYSKNRGKKLKLVFSDEFNRDGRSFYPGDDPFWEAVDLNYWQTKNYEWYDPEAITTRNGKLEIKLERHPEHNLNFRGGMLQSWNKFCFTGGLLIASIQLPGKNTAAGLWPAFWIMGNLGRAGFGASLQGTWPYSHDKCDVGTLINQTFANGTPVWTTEGGDVTFNQKHHTRSLSFLPGQKLSACTCPGEDHPGPFDEHTQTFKGRAAPEMDVFEAQHQDDLIYMSQSCQMAPFNYKYNITAVGPTGRQINATEAYRFFDRDGELNTYTGEVVQQALSGVSPASQTAIQANAPTVHNAYTYNEAFATYSLEYAPGENGWASWTSNGKRTWELYPGALSPDPRTRIGRRIFPSEPMYIIMNLGISKNFGSIDWDKLTNLWDEYGALRMQIDWVRVYQDPAQISDDSLSCSPSGFPTTDYIERHISAYTNPNYTVWGKEPGGYQGDWPRNRLYNNGNGCTATRIGVPGDPATSKPYRQAKYYPSHAIGHES